MTSTSPENEFDLPNPDRDLEFDLYLDLPDNDRDLTGKRATSPEKRRAGEWRNKQGRRRGARVGAVPEPPRTTTLAARPAVDHNPVDLEPPPSTNQRRKQRGKVEEWAARGGGGRGNGTKFETAAHYARRLKRWRIA